MARWSSTPPPQPFLSPPLPPLLLQPFINPMDLDAALAKRKRNPTCSDPELQRSTAVRQPGKELRRRVEQRRSHISGDPLSSTRRLDTREQVLWHERRIALVYPCPKGSAGDPNSIALEARRRKCPQQGDSRGIRKRRPGGYLRPASLAATSSPSRGGAD